MASIQHLICDAEIFPRHVIKQQKAFQSVEKERHFAALQIQKTYRGYLVRKEVRRWHRAAIVLQKYIRRYLVKIHMCDYFRAYLDHYRMGQYHRIATKIQALWRGYWYRKNNINAHEMITQRRRVEQANERMVNLMRVAFANQGNFRKEMLDDEAQKWVIYIIFKLHHHLRTHLEGIYSLHNKQQLSDLEKLIQTMPLTDYMKELKKKYYEEIKKKPKPYPYVFKTAKSKAIEDVYRKLMKEHGVRDTIKVDRSIHDKPFMLSRRLGEQKYERSMLLTEKYPAAKFSFARTQNVSKQVTPQDFDLNVLKKIISHLKPPPYHIDFWDQLCQIHNLQEY